MSRFLLLGDSHIPMFCGALEAAGAADTVSSMMLCGALRLEQPFVAVEAGELRFTDEQVQRRVIARVEQLGCARLDDCRNRLLLSLGLHAPPFYANLARHGFEFGSLPLSPRRYLSAAVIEQTVIDRQAPVLEFYRYCLERGLVAAVFAAPRPQRRHPAAEFYGERLLDLVAAYQAPVRRLLAEFDCPLVESPDTIGADGFLPERFWGRDRSHGNSDYGMAVVERWLGSVKFE